jgi:hypothetical protein
VTVRPRGIVTAMVRTTDSDARLADVFGLVFDNTQTVEVLDGACVACFELNAVY